MKYKSELIKEIVETRGHELSSPHYESECVESWIEETKGAYPKLCDYQSEWLNYINENPLGEFPYETVTDVTDATVNNVVPYAYKSAILKGQTLVNIKGEESGDVPIDANKHDILIPLVKKNTDYLIKYDTTLSGGVLAIGFLNNNSTWSKNLEKQPNIGLIRLNSGEYPNYFRIRAKDEQTVAINNLMIIEYQDGMENWDIPYFEGMQSVKMPVLTTTGKNLFDGELEAGWISDGENVNSVRYTRCKNFIDVSENKTYAQSIEGISIMSISFYDENKEFIGSANATSIFTPPQKSSFMRFTISDTSLKLDRQIQIEESSTATAYEPYKSNILTVNEDIELRGIGEVRDELDCLTGQVTERIGETTFNGSEDWTLGTNETANTIRFKTVLQANIPAVNDIVTIISDNFPVLKNANINVESVQLWGSTKEFTVRILKTKASTVDEFKSYLSQNPITIQYELATESIKTVDLSIQDQDGNTLSEIKPIEGTMHIHSDGTPLKPTITMEIPVEATTQNLASFIKEE